MRKKFRDGPNTTMYQTFIKPLYTDVKTFVLDTLFPISCLSCGAEGEFICGACKLSIAKLEHQRCIVCQKQTPFGLTHSGCQTPNGADGLISFYNYRDEKVSQIIIAGKYKFVKDSYKTLGQMIAKRLENEHDHLLYESYSLVPIPLHSSRLRWRGFNQAEILCQALSTELNMPVMEPLIRHKTTKTQKDLKRAERLKNLQDAFKLKPGADVHSKNLILVDDVTTTGATLQEAAKVLKRNGASKVICLTVARD
jgi:competence protein ComFC